MARRNLNEYKVNSLTRINWRASLVPAAAVIPAPIAYIKVVAVKKFVVGFEGIGEKPVIGCLAGKSRLGCSKARSRLGDEIEPLVVGVNF